MGLIAIYETA